MKKRIFYLLDVFAESRYTGNQLAVLRDARKLSDEEMLKIAKEMNYSETTFIIPEKKADGGYDVRIFTPAEEVPFAGHPTLGTAFIINQEIDSGHEKQILLNLKVGQIPVSLKYTGNKVDFLQMKQNSPKFFSVMNKNHVAMALNLSPVDIDPGFPVQEVSTGLPFIIVPLISLDAVKRAVINKNLFFEMIKEATAKAILLFCPDTYETDNDLNVRAFVDYYGIPEDPATGSGNGCLAGYLVKHKYFGSNKINVHVEQGYEIGRPSRLTLIAEARKNRIDVFVGGKVIMVAKCELL
jgi:trans-2,3-dihydro-3-hydroxyanthranilate isomerase